MVSELGAERQKFGGVLRGFVRCRCRVNHIKPCVTVLWSLLAASCVKHGTLDGGCSARSLAYPLLRSGYSSAILRYSSVSFPPSAESAYCVTGATTTDSKRPAWV